MGSKSKKADCIEQQEVLQAVVIADNFNDRFLPLTSEKPTVLFPLVNKVLLDYSLEALAKCGVQETYVFCCSHAQQIRTYVHSKWSVKDAAMTVTVLSSESVMSVGDVIRELDSQALIRSDFILISGNTVTTLNLINILEEHRKRRKTDKGCSMTLIYRHALPKHRSRCLEDDAVIAIESHSNKVRFYQKIKKKKTLHIPLEVFQENSKVAVHYDLLNCHMCICSPSIPPLYSDNFDYQTLDDLIRGLIINEEILGSSMYLHLANSGYAANVSNLYMYDIVSRDIIQRWSYPVVPDLCLSNGSRMSHLRHNIYKITANLDRTCVLRKNVVVGKGTTVGENSCIEDSVIGNNCSIGSNVTIKGSYIWDNVTVGDNCTLDTCLLADDVVLNKHTNVKAGCVLSYKVIIGDHVDMPALTKLQYEIPVDTDGFGDSDNDTETDFQAAAAFDLTYVGFTGHGYLYTEPEDSDSEDEIKDVWGQKMNNSFDSDEQEEEGDSSVGSLSASQVIRGNSPEEDDTLLFYTEVLESLQCGIDEHTGIDNVILEINASKHAYNVTIKELNTFVTKAIMAIPNHGREDALPPQEYFAKLKPTVVHFTPLISNYIKNTGSQLDCLQAIEDFVLDNEGITPVFVKILHFFYEKEILNENTIMKWFDNPSTTKAKDIRKHIVPFVKWLKEADEESSSEE